MIALRRPRAAAQLLHRPGALAPEALVRRLLAVQAQDLAGAYLALRARTPGLTAAAIGAALTADRSLVVTWLCRGTLHLVAPGDLPWLLALTAPGRMTASRRRLGQEGVTADEAERGVAIVERALAADGPLTRAQLGERLDAQGVRTAGQALIHLLGLAGLRGLVVRGPVVAGGGQAFVLARDWIGEPRAARPTATPRSPSSPAAISPPTGRPGRPTSPPGPVCPCATPARACRPWPARSSSSRTAWSTSPAASRSPSASRRGCCPRSTPTCSAGATAASPCPPSTPGASIRAGDAARGRDARRHRGRHVERAAPRRAPGGRARPFAPLDADTAAALGDEAADVARFEGLSR